MEMLKRVVGKKMRVPHTKSTFFHLMTDGIVSCIRIYLNIDLNWQFFSISVWPASAHIFFFKYSGKSLFHLISWLKWAQTTFDFPTPSNTVFVLFPLLYSMYPSCLSSYFCLQASYLFPSCATFVFIAYITVAFVIPRTTRIVSDYNDVLIVQFVLVLFLSWFVSFLRCFLLAPYALSLSLTLSRSFHRLLSIDRCAFLCSDTLLWSHCVIYYCTSIITPSTSPDCTSIARFISIPVFHSLRLFTAT